jgi:hypothetical protein
MMRVSRVSSQVVVVESGYILLAEMLPEEGTREEKLARLTGARATARAVVV